MLSDDSKRQMYDASGHSQYTQGGMPGGGTSTFTSHQAEEIFRQFFGGGFGGGSIFDQDFMNNSHQLLLHLSFNEAVRGCEKEISMRVQAPCDRCFGSGGEPGTKEQTCPYCRGTGQVSVMCACIRRNTSWVLFLCIRSKMHKYCMVNMDR